MAQLMSPFSESTWKLVELLREAYGLPRHMSFLRITVDAEGPSLVQVECRYYPSDEQGRRLVEDERFVQLTKKFRLVEAE